MSKRGVSERIVEIQNYNYPSVVCNSDIYKSNMDKARSYMGLKQSVQCRVVYDSMRNLLTKPAFPFYDLRYCQKAKCKVGEYKCQISGYCVSINNICDNVNHCPYHDDEISCGI